MRNYSNPRLEAEFDDWPSGANRVKCRFQVEHHAKRGYRVGRTTTNPKTGGWNATKWDTYGGRAVIADGDDGKTYILQEFANYNCVGIKRHDFMNAPGESSVYYKDAERYNQLLALINSAY